MTRRILVGIVGAPHGVRGEVRLKSFTERPTAIADYGPLQSEDGRQTLTIAAARPLKDDMLVVRIKGVDTREAAAALTGLRLTLDRAALPAADEDEFYHADLIGLDAVGEDGARIGRVNAIVNYGAGDIVEIATEAGDQRLVAFTRVFVPVIDIDARRLVVAAAALQDPDDNDPGPSEPGPGLMWDATVLTLFPDWFPGPLGASLAGEALRRGTWSLKALDIRAHGIGRHRAVDDTPAGGGPGMVMRADVVAAALDDAVPAEMSGRASALARAGSR